MHAEKDKAVSISASESFNSVRAPAVKQRVVLAGVYRDPISFAEVLKQHPSVVIWPICQLAALEVPEALRQGNA